METITKEIYGVPVKFVRIPAGTFMMGSPDTEEYRYTNETQHRVRITKSFDMMTTPVTQELWFAVMGINPSYFRGSDLPVETISWDECQNFIRRLKDPLFRLPTEAEWEYACRAGSGSSVYGKLDEIAWYSRNSGSQTHPVGQKLPNAWGLYDMLGNVWEWCQDWKGEYSDRPVTNPTGPSTGSYRVRRGGSWYHGASGVRAAVRDGVSPGARNSNLGFRLVLETGERDVPERDVPEREQSGENDMVVTLKDTEREQVRQKLLDIRDAADSLLAMLEPLKVEVSQTVFKSREVARSAARSLGGTFKVQKHPESGWVLVKK